MKWFPITYYPMRLFWRFSNTHCPIKNRTVEPNDLEAWQRFFETEQDNQTPHALLYFAWTCWRHGVPDFGNSYIPQTERYMSAYPGGYLAQHIEYLLTPDDTQYDARFTLAAAERIALLLYLEHPMHSVVKYWNTQDIHFACALALQQHYAEYIGVESEKAIQYALLNNFLEPSITLGLAVSRNLLEQARYPSPIMRLLRWSFSMFEKLKPKPKAPPIALNQWRERRASVLNHTPSSTSLFTDEAELLGHPVPSQEPSSISVNNNDLVVKRATTSADSTDI